MLSDLFVDPLDEHGQDEDGGDGRSQVAGDGLDVVKELAALSCLHHGDPADTDGYDAQHPHPAQKGGSTSGCALNAYLKQFFDS